MKRFTTLLVCILLGSLQLILAQASEVTGTVIDANSGEALPGVNIVIKNTTTGTITDVDGSYSINAEPDGILVFSYLGYETTEVPVNNRTTVDISLESEAIGVGEVVVVGYGSMERTNVTGAISSLKAEELAKAPVPNVVEALRGQVSGVRIERESGMPGSGVKFTIRGKNSISKRDTRTNARGDDYSNNNEPLIVIDGVPTTGGNIAEINPADIASIDILKDAAAASIYGASGANGVVLITTKRGTVGKPTLSVNVSYGLTDLVQQPVLFNGPEYAQLKLDAAEGAGDPSTIDDVLTDPVERANYDAGTWVDWHDVLLRQGIIKNVGVSLTGGTEKFKYYMNGDAYLERGIVQHTDYNRYSFRVNSDYTPYKFLTVGARVQVSRSVSDETGNSATIYEAQPDFTDFLGNSPLGRTHDNNGELVRTVKGDQFQYNPLFRYENSATDRQTSRNYINPYIELQLIKGLKYNLNTFMEQRNQKYRRFTSSRYEEDEGESTMEIEFAENTTYLLDNILTYTKVIGQKHSINATAVYGMQKFEADTLNTYGEDADTDLLEYYAISGIPSVNTTVEQSPVEWGKVYYVGRLRYGFDDRYIVTLTIRRDGSSKFGANNKWGNFPSASFAWNAHNEAFFGNLTALSLFKYRISYGIMGNDRIDDYGFISLAQDVSYPFAQTVYTGKTTQTAPNQSLKWEKSNQLNTGIDFGFFDDRILGTVDYYRTRTTDLLLLERIPATTGYDEVISNVGETKNWGIDASLTGKVFTGEFQWDITVNWAKDKNEIVSLTRSDVDAEGNPIDDVTNGWFIGQDIDVVYDFDYIGVWQLGEEEQALAMHPDRPFYGPGDTKVRDINGDGIITFEDETFLGSPTPDYYGGVRNTFRYKGLELTVLVEFVQGVTKINYAYGGLTGRDNDIKVDYWTPDNPTNDFPQPHALARYFYEDAVRVRDASFVSLRNVSLTYTLPPSLLKNIPIQYVSFYVRGNNLKYFTDYKDSYSPEQEHGRFPTIKTWSFGTNITF